MIFLSAVLYTCLLNWILFRLLLLQEPCSYFLSLHAPTPWLAGSCGARAALVSAEEGQCGPCRSATTSCLEGLTEKEQPFPTWLWAAGCVTTAFEGGKGGKAEECSSVQWHQETVTQFRDTILDEILKMLYPQMWYRIFPFVLSGDRQAHVVQSGFFF